MTQQVYKVRLDDTNTALSVTLKQDNESGVSTAYNLTGKTVKVKIVDSDGTVVVAETTTGVSSSGDSTGQVDYTFDGSSIASAGVYYLYFVVYTGSAKDTFPVEPRSLLLDVSSDVQTGREAYLAAL